MQRKMMWVVLLGMGLILWVQAPALAQYDEKDDREAAAAEDVNPPAQEGDQEAQDAQADESRDARHQPPAGVRVGQGAGQRCPVAC